MPDLKPTLATAAVNANGVVFDVYGLKGTPDPVEHVPCLILPAPRPIAEAPKDGRKLMLYCGEEIVSGKWSDFYKAWIARGPNSAVYAIVVPAAFTAMPPPSPEEAQDGK